MKVFQYGSNLSSARLNSDQRLCGEAVKVAVVRTRDNWEFEFTVWSKGLNAAAASIRPGGDRQIWGVLWEIPEDLIFRDRKREGRKTLDQIEGEGKNYDRITIALEGDVPEALTYVAKDPKPDIRTSAEYVAHIMTGLREHNIDPDYIAYVESVVRRNNPTV